jgi:hypothetical protein
MAAHSGSCSIEPRAPRSEMLPLPRASLAEIAVDRPAGRVGRPPSRAARSVICRVFLNPPPRIFPCRIRVTAESKKPAGSISNPMTNDCAMPCHHSLAPPLWVNSADPRSPAPTVMS